MINLVGEVPDRASLLSIPDAHLHLYGKAPREGRKLGHVTVCRSDAVIRDARVAAVRALFEKAR